MSIPIINRQSTDQWKADSEASVDYYNNWFLHFAPPSFRRSREEAAKKVEEAFFWTNNCCHIDTEALMAHPAVMAVARQLTCPPLARDRLAGLAHIDSSFLKDARKGTEKLFQNPVALSSKRLCPSSPPCWTRTSCPGWCLGKPRHPSFS